MSLMALKANRDHIKPVLFIIAFVVMIFVRLFPAIVTQQNAGWGQGSFFNSAIYRLSGLDSFWVPLLFSSIRFIASCLPLGAAAIAILVLSVLWRFAVSFLGSRNCLLATLGRSIEGSGCLPFFRLPIFPIDSSAACFASSLQPVLGILVSVKVFNWLRITLWAILVTTSLGSHSSSLREYKDSVIILEKMGLVK